MRILVIDDTRHVRAAIKTALEVANHDVVAVETGPLGLRAFDEEAFDAAIVDVFMLEMDGMTVIKELRRRAPRLPIVVISGGVYGETALDILTTASGLTGVAYLQKPFRPDQLIAALEKAVRRSRVEGRFENSSRRCEERGDEAVQSRRQRLSIASASLAMTKSLIRRPRQPRLYHETAGARVGDAECAQSDERQRLHHVALAAGGIGRQRADQTLDDQTGEAPPRRASGPAAADGRQLPWPPRCAWQAGLPALGAERAARHRVRVPPVRRAPRTRGGGSPAPTTQSSQPPPPAPTTDPARRRRRVARRRSRAVRSHRSAPRQGRSWPGNNGRPCRPRCRLWRRPARSAPPPCRLRSPLVAPPQGWLRGARQGGG